MRFWLQTGALLVVLFAGFEIAARLVLGHSPLTRLDRQYGWLLAPEQPIVQSREGFTNDRTNELGHLDEPMPSSASPDSILVLGDSFTEGRHVARADRFTDRLGAILGRRVYNVGHVGWSPLNAIAFLDAERQRFAPQTTIVQVSSNDLADFVSRRRMHLTEPRAGAFGIALPIKNERGLSRHLDRSAFAALLFDRLTAQLGEGADPMDAPSCANISELAKRALPWIMSELQRVGDDVRLVYLPDLDYHAGCVDRCVEARELYRRAAIAAHVRFVDVTTAICVRFAETRQPLHGFWNTVPGRGHLNSEGHAVVAEVIAAHLRN